MLKFANATLVMMLIISAFVLYSLEHSVRKNERYIAALDKEIIREAENIKVLNAEWSFLIRPGRLERLAGEHLQLRQAQPYQLVMRDDLAGLMPLRPAIEPAAGSQDLIGKMLEALE